MTEFAALELVASTLVTGTSVALLVTLDWNEDMCARLEQHVLKFQWITRMLVAFWLMGIVLRLAQVFIWVVRPFIDLWSPGATWFLDQCRDELQHYHYLRTYRPGHAG